MSSPPPPALRRYRIERYLTEGGMGAIYLGKRLGAGGFERPVVLKQLLPEFTSRPEFRDLFFREARISASLDHVNIVRTYDLVRSDDTLFIVMEYVRGSDLRTISWRSRVRRQPLSTAAILFVAQEALAGLAYMHGKTDAQGKNLGFIHRDLSPSNILCSADGEVKLSDFGIAKATAFASVFYRVRGKVGYMSPEQARSETIDARSDLFSLAVCIFETFIGSRLFVGDLQTPPDEVYARPLPRLSGCVPGAPPELDAVFRRALSADPAGRFQSAEGFFQALRAVAHRHGLIYSPSEFAAELKRLLGPDVDRWGQDDGGASGETERLPLAGQAEARQERLGKEARPLESLDAGADTSVTAPFVLE